MACRKRKCCSKLIYIKNDRWFGKRKGYSVDRTKIGEINVSSHVVKNKLYFGGEGNGGIIVPAVTPGRDSLLGIALILELMAKTGKTITELVNEIPKYEIVKEKLRSIKN